jgi:hypothetical protein
VNPSEIVTGEVTEVFMRPPCQKAFKPCWAVLAAILARALFRAETLRVLSIFPEDGTVAHAD